MMHDVPDTQHSRKIHFNSASLTPWGRRMLCALGPRLVNIGDDSDGSIVADNPG